MTAGLAARMVASWAAQRRAAPQRAFKVDQAAQDVGHFIEKANCSGV